VACYGCCAVGEPVIANRPPLAIDQYLQSSCDRSDVCGLTCHDLASLIVTQSYSGAYGVGYTAITRDAHALLHSAVVLTPRVVSTVPQSIFLAVTRDVIQPDFADRIVALSLADDWNS